MSNKPIIYFIYAENCNDCIEMRRVLDKAITVSHYLAGSSIDIREINSETDEAVNVAIENNIDDLPSCIIGDKVFCGKDSYTLDSMLQAINKLK